MKIGLFIKIVLLLYYTTLIIGYNVFQRGESYFHKEATLMKEYKRI